MTGNTQKTPLQRSITQFATAKASDAIQKLGKALPASVVSIKGSIVTVKFEVQDTVFNTLPNVQCPLFGPEYIRYPIQTGCKGVVFPADAYLGGMSGLGGGVANLTQPANLTTLVFFPIANTAWKAVDSNILTLYGVNGTTIQDTVNNASKVAVTPTSVTTTAANNGSTITQTQSSITLSCAGHTLVINGSGILLDGILFATHDHINSQPGIGVTGPVGT